MFYPLWSRVQVSSNQHETVARTTGYCVLMPLKVTILCSNNHTVYHMFSKIVQVLFSGSIRLNYKLPKRKVIIFFCVMSSVMAKPRLFKPTKQKQFCLISVLFVLKSSQKSLCLSKSLSKDGGSWQENDGPQTPSLHIIPKILYFTKYFYWQLPFVLLDVSSYQIVCLFG